MVFVTFAKPVESSWIVSDNDCVHAFGDRDLPGIVFAHTLCCTALAQRCAFGMLTTDGLPAESSKRLPHGAGVGRTFQNFC